MLTRACQKFTQKLREAAETTDDGRRRCRDSRSPRSPLRAARSFRGGSRDLAMRRSVAALILLMACLDARDCKAAGEAVRLPEWQGGNYLSAGAASRLRGTGLTGTTDGGNTNAAGGSTRASETATDGTPPDEEDTGGLPAKNTVHVDPTRITPISWSPRAYLYRGFLKTAECDYIIQNAEPKLVKSTVVDNETGKSVPSTIRTSDGSFIARGGDDVVADIERRIAEWSHVPVDHGEGLQVLRYAPGQKYEAHMDSFSDSFNTEESKGGQRVATVLMYLSTPERGGETVFPRAAEKPHAFDEAFSECARRGVAVKARKGDALLFWSTDASGALDVKSTHAGCPVQEGVKWSATKWMHVGSFQSGHKTPFRNGICDDEVPECAEWARQGECDANPSYMVGPPHEDGSCMRSCGKCPAGSKPNPTRKSTTMGAL